jgi:hypothetical protein
MRSLDPLPSLYRTRNPLQGISRVAEFKMGNACASDRNFDANVPKSTYLRIYLLIQVIDILESLKIATL